MQYRIDTKTGNKISILGFGCMRLPSNLGQINIEKTEALFLKAIKEGVNYFDTAYIYPGSEAALGQILDKNNLRNSVYIATKLPIMMCKKFEDFDRIFNKELERLKTDYIDYYFMHMVTSPAQWQLLCDLGIEKWIEEKKASGQIKQVGFSFHGKKDDFTALVDLYNWDFCQIQYNYMNINYQAGRDGLRYAYEKGMPIFIMEPLLGGRLADGVPEKAVNVMKSTKPELSKVGWALNWLWNQPEVTMVLSGMNEMSHLEENLSLADHATVGMWGKAEEKIFSQVEAIFNEAYKVPCTGCNYCMPCPQNINIPGCFTAYNTSFAIKKSTGLNQYMINTGAMTQTPAFASNCVSCGKCEKHCPQNIEIIKELKNVKKRLEPVWLKPVMSVARKVMR